MFGISENMNKENKLRPLDVLFFIFCLFPFIFPNPIVKTNIQPYASLLGTIIIFSEIFVLNNSLLNKNKSFFGIAWATLFVALLVLCFSGITVESLRAVFNYYSLAIVPLATYFILCRVEEFPENLLKALILIWFIVSLIQFFIDRSFLTSIISGVRFSYSYRGVVGLASEPSFLGIASFYFLHMIMKFKKNKMLYFAIALVMGTLFAQSMMGVLFIGAFIVVYLLDETNSQKGFYIWGGALLAVIVFLILLNTVLVETRLYELFSIFLDSGIDGVLHDESANARYDSLSVAISDAFENFLMPLGYTKRIGSGYGGFLCELGFFSLPILFSISFTMSKTFKKKFSKILYFIIITTLLFNNTQIGNSLLLVVLALNMKFPIEDKIKGDASIAI